MCTMYDSEQIKIESFKSYFSRVTVQCSKVPKSYQEMTDINEQRMVKEARGVKL